MKLLYVCSAGSRRSMALAAYTVHLKQRYGREELTVSSAALHGERLRRDAEKREPRLRECERASAGRYRSAVEVLRAGGSDVHPRMGVLLLEDGVRGIATQRTSVATAELLNAYDLVLGVERAIRDQLAERAPAHGRIDTVKGFLGYPEHKQDIPDFDWYALPFTAYQLSRDRELRNELKEYAAGVLERLSSTAENAACLPETC